MANREMEFRIEQNGGVRELVVYGPNDNPDEDAAMRIQLPRGAEELSLLLQSLTSEKGNFIVSPSVIASLISSATQQ